MPNAVNTKAHLTVERCDSVEIHEVTEAATGRFCNHFNKLAAATHLLTPSFGALDCNLRINSQFRKSTGNSSENDFTGCEGHETHPRAKETQVPSRRSKHAVPREVLSVRKNVSDFAYLARKILHTLWSELLDCRGFINQRFKAKAAIALSAL